MAQILDGRTPEAIRQAVAQLKAGRLVAFPTETVYGLGADALDAQAVLKIFEAKGRPASNPLIVHVVDKEAGAELARFDAHAEALAAAFWPGPLTLVLRKKSQVPDIVTAGGPTVALRAPGHPVAMALLKAFGGPLAAPSANRSNQISPSRAEHVAAGLGAELDIILDGGPAQVGIESTVIDLSSQAPRILRPGSIDQEALASVLGAAPAENNDGARADTKKSPGQMARHYSPKKRLRLFDGAPPTTPRIVLLTWSQEASGPAGRRLPADPAGYARELYSALHWADQQEADEIWVESVPGSGSWAGIRDRLNRAQHRDPNDKSSE